jgi:uncharacterized protein YggE
MAGLPFEGPHGERLRTALFAAVVLLGVFLAVQAIGGVLGWRYIGSGVSASNTISVSGHGEALAVPDIATFTYSAVSTKATVADAQADTTAKANAITAYLKSAGVDEKDIQTSGYSINPQYDYQSQICPATAPGATPVYCGGGKQVLRGYEVRQSTTVKVRDTAKAGDLLSGVGDKGATELSGLTFTFDKPEATQTEARNKAIADAKAKADVLAKQLGVTLVRVVSFNENGSGYPQPYAYGRGGATANQAMDVKSVAPEISVGQNNVTNDVTVTYEIK